MRRTLLLCIIVTPLLSNAQDINVEYDKNRDLSRYKSFSIGESEVITPKEQRQAGDSSVLKWIATSVSEELTEKGLQRKDSLGDLVVSYVIGSQEKTDFSNLGPLGTSPGNSSQIWSRDFRMGSLIIDLNDRNSNLIWRVNATTTATTADTKRLIDEVVSAGFKKFTLKPKKVKKK
jgi:hypothetical protein